MSAAAPHFTFTYDFFDEADGVPDGDDPVGSATVSVDVDTTKLDAISTPAKVGVLTFALQAIAFDLAVDESFIPSPNGGRLTDVARKALGWTDNEFEALRGAVVLGEVAVSNPTGCVSFMARGGVAEALGIPTAD